MGEWGEDSISEGVSGAGLLEEHLNGDPEEVRTRQIPWTQRG